MIELRPQPIGIYDGPASNLILPAVDQADRGALSRLLAGDVEVSVPEPWRFFVAAARGELEAAREWITDDEPVLAMYNRFVLAPTAADYESVRPVMPDDLAALIDIAAYSMGIVDDLADSFDLDGELLAFALAARAAAEMERGEDSDAIASLREAVAEARGCSPLLASMLLAQLADIVVASPASSPAIAITQYREAVRLAGECRLPEFLGGLYTRLGMALQNTASGGRSALLEAVRAYQAALNQEVTQDRHPEWYAQLQNNLGLAYLSMPSAESSDQLRIGIAIQSFRQALQVYTPQSNPDRWASVSMNLANALQYAPTSHPEENLIQAVEVYEEILRVRSRAKDPVAYATVLLNQSNALAHLGIFKPALEKLAEAYKLFHWYEQAEQAEAARELVEQINQRMDQQRQLQKLSYE